jgi:hypothetical protein
MIRKLTDHIVAADLPQSQLLVGVEDRAGSGGASHAYLISGYSGDANPSLPDELKGHWAGGMLILFQNGPIKEAGLNGITQEVLLAIVIDRLRGFQGGQFSSRENAIALTKCQEALFWLQARTRDRIARGVEGSLQN